MISTLLLIFIWLIFSLFSYLISKHIIVKLENKWTNGDVIYYGTLSLLFGPLPLAFMGSGILLLICITMIDESEYYNKFRAWLKRGSNW